MDEKYEKFDEKELQKQEEKSPEEEEPAFDLEESEDSEEVEEQAQINDDYLAHIEINDTVGLYLKEAGRVPLLTHEQEVEITQRIETINAGQMLQVSVLPNIDGPRKSVTAAIEGNNQGLVEIAGIVSAGGMAVVVIVKTSWGGNPV